MRGDVGLVKGGVVWVRQGSPIGGVLLVFDKFKTDTFIYLSLSSVVVHHS